jgi:hypothetical protein
MASKGPGLHKHFISLFSEGPEDMYPICLLGLQGLTYDIPQVLLCMLARKDTTPNVVIIVARLWLGNCLGPGMDRQTPAFQDGGMALKDGIVFLCATGVLQEGFRHNDLW